MDLKCNQNNQRITERILACNAQKTENLEGCQKMSEDMLTEIGKAGVSKVEFNTLVWLACNQNRHGQVYCSVHMLMEGIGISDPYFPGILYKLKDKGLIDFTRTKEWKEDKNAVYKVTLPYNSFEDNSFRGKKYFRLAHGVFRSQKFYDLPVAGKYILLQAAFALSGMPLDHFDKRKECSAELNYWRTFNNCVEWGSYSKRTVSEAFRLIQKEFKCKRARGYSPSEGTPYKAFVITLERSDCAATCSDNYALYSNILYAAFEEEGGELFDTLKRQDALEHAADLIIRYEGRAKEMYKKAMEDYGKIALIRQAHSTLYHGVNLKDEHKVTHEYSRPLSRMVEKTVAATRKSGIPNSILEDTNIPLWFRFLVAEALSAFRWLSNILSLKDIELSDVNVKVTVGEFMNMLLYDEKKYPFDYVIEKIKIIREQ